MDVENHSSKLVQKPKTPKQKKLSEAEKAKILKDLESNSRFQKFKQAIEVFFSDPPITFPVKKKRQKRFHSFYYLIA